MEKQEIIEHIEKLAKEAKEENVRFSALWYLYSEIKWKEQEEKREKENAKTKEQFVSAFSNMLGGI